MTEEKVRAKAWDQTQDIWNSVIFGSLWRLFIICTVSEWIVILTYRDDSSYTTMDFIRTFCFVPMFGQAIVLVVTKLIFTLFEDKWSDLSLGLFSIIATNIFSGIAVAVHTSVSFIPMLLLLPIELVSVYKRKGLIIIQVFVTSALYILDRLWIIPNTKIVLDIHPVFEIMIFFLIAIAFAVLEEQVRKSSLQLDLQVWKDSLTNLYNHEAFYEELEEAMAEYKDKQEPFSIFIADIDNFKSVNDTYGHAFGDEVIRLVAKTMEENRGSRDFAARYGGEEFAMIMRGKSIGEAIVLADKFRRDFASHEMETRDGKRSFTISIGVAEYTHPYATSSSFFEEADRVLYKAKATGKNKVCRNY